MQSTSIHILPVLELGAPPAAASREPEEATAFDSLLCSQPPPPACPPPPPPAEAYDERSAPSDDAVGDASELESAAANTGAGQSEAVADGKPSAAENDDDTAEDERPEDADAVAESIAAAAAAAVVTPLPETTPDEVFAAAPASAPTATIPAPAGGEVSATVAPEVVDENAVPAATAAEAPTIANDQGATVNLVLDAKHPGEGNPELKSEATEPASRHFDLPKDADQPALHASPASPFEPSAGDSQDPSQETAANPTAGEPASGSNRPQFPAVEQAAIAGAAPDAKLAGGEPVGTISHTAVIDATSGTVPRSRLPAAVLAREPAASRGAAPIDTSRLLSRVARAFTAAQQQGGEIQLRLSPPELGSLRLVVQIEDRALVAHLEAETPAARAALIDNLPVLRERLAEQGVRIHRFDVDLMQRHAGDHPGGMPQRPQEQEQYVFPQRTASGRQPALPAATRPRLFPVSPGGLNVIV